MPEDMTAALLPSFRVWNRGGDRQVLALHCSLAHSGAWSALAERLAGVTVTATDQPGHGRAPDWDGQFDLHDSATADAIAMAEEIGQGEAVDVLGHSFGGTVALRLAVERPDLVRSLTLIEPVLFAAAGAAGHPAYAPFRAAHLAFADLVRAGRADEALERFHGLWGNGVGLAALPEKTLRYMQDRIHLIVGQNPVLLDDAAGLLRPAGLEQMRVPVLLVEGADSPPIIDAIHAALAQRLPMASRLAIPGAGHMVPITHPDAIAAAIQAHLDAC